MKRELVILIAAVGLVSVLSGIGAEPEGETKTSSAKVLETFEISPKGEPILLPVVLGDKKVLFLLSLGAARSTFDLSLREHLTAAKPAAGPADSKTPPDPKRLWIVPKEASLGTIRFRTGGAVYCRDLSDLRRLSGLEIHGIVGAGLLCRYAVQLDFDAGKLRILESDDATHEDWGKPTEIKTTPFGCPFLAATAFGKEDVLFALDTAYRETGMLSEDVFRRLHLRGLIGPVTESRLGDGQAVRGAVATRVDLNLGDLKYPGLIFDRHAGVSVLGLSFLSRHKVTLDVPNSRLYLLPGKRFTLTDQQDMSGLHLQKIDKKIVVHSVDPDSPAAGAGLKAKDVVLKLDGKDATDYTLAELRAALRDKDGRTVRLRFGREDTEADASFALKKKL